MIPHYRILVLDFGSQYTQLITRRVRELGVYSDLVPCDIPFDKLPPGPIDGIILSGGPKSVHQADAWAIPEWAWQQDCPVLGICYGMQAMAQHFGGNIVPGAQQELGHATITLAQDHWMQDDPTTMDAAVWMSHGDHLESCPNDFNVIAKSADGIIAAIEHTSKPYIGFQFHPEVTHSPMGLSWLAYFVHDLCGCDESWQSDQMAKSLIDDIRKQVGTEHVVLGLSGGVDSAVTAALVHQAIGDQLICVCVDNGLLRQDELSDIKKTFGQHLHIPLHVVDARTDFLEKLKGIVEPEEKRKRIGHAFIEHFEHAILEHPEVKWLAQGTIYPDVIESAGAHSGKAHVIKSHHNVGGLPEDLSLKLLEPLSALFKDEVRALGHHLGLPDALLKRHPFPGPGLAVRIMGEVTESRLDALRKADQRFMALLRKHDYYDRVAQAFAVYLPVKTVGVMGDKRAWGDVIALRAVETVDFMTARWAHLPHELLAEASRSILNEVPGICRVVYDLSDKPPGTIEWE